MILKYLCRIKRCISIDVMHVTCVTLRCPAAPDDNRTADINTLKLWSSIQRNKHEKNPRWQHIASNFWKSEEDSYGVFPPERTSQLIRHSPSANLVFAKAHAGRAVGSHLLQPVADWGRGSVGCLALCMNRKKKTFETLSSGAGATNVSKIPIRKWTRSEEDREKHHCWLT